MTEASTLGWVTAEQQTRLAAFTPDWPSWLMTHLALSWPDWEGASDESRIAYVEKMLDSALVLTPIGDEPAKDGSVDGATDEAVTSENGHTTHDVGVSDLGWVSIEQRAVLEPLAATRGEWYEWLPFELDALWPDWRHSTADVLTAWFDTVWPSLITPVETDALSTDEQALGPATPSNATDLTWVTTVQASRLEMLDRRQGEWRSWLPEKLDAIGDWRNSAPDDLVAWLDLIIPSLVQGSLSDPSPDSTQNPDPTAAHDPDEAVGAPPDGDVDAAAEELTAVLAEALADNPDMAELAARLTAEELAEILAEAMLHPAVEGRGSSNG